MADDDKNELRRMRLARFAPESSAEAIDSAPSGGLPTAQGAASLPGAASVGSQFSGSPASLAVESSSPAEVATSPQILSNATPQGISHNVALQGNMASPIFICLPVGGIDGILSFLNNVVGKTSAPVEPLSSAAVPAGDSSGSKVTEIPDEEPASVAADRVGDSSGSQVIQISDEEPASFAPAPGDEYMLEVLEMPDDEDSLPDISFQSGPTQPVDTFHNNNVDTSANVEEDTPPWRTNVRFNPPSLKNDSFKQAADDYTKRVECNLGTFAPIGSSKRLNSSSSVLDSDDNSFGSLPQPHYSRFSRFNGQATSTQSAAPHSWEKGDTTVNSDKPSTSSFFNRNKCGTATTCSPRASTSGLTASGCATAHREEGTFQGGSREYSCYCALPYCTHEQDVDDPPPKRKPGRPKGSKNKKASKSLQSCAAEYSSTTSNQPSNLCKICRSDDGGKLVVTSCGHLFHQSCLTTWITTSHQEHKERKTCPYCGGFFTSYVPFFS